MVVADWSCRSLKNSVQLYTFILPKAATISLSYIQWNKATTGWWLEHSVLILDVGPSSNSNLPKHGGKMKALLSIFKTSIWKHCGGNSYKIISKPCTLALASAATWPSAHIQPAARGPQHAVWPRSWLEHWLRMFMARHFSWQLELIIILNFTAPQKKQNTWCCPASNKKKTDRRTATLVIHLANGISLAFYLVAQDFVGRGRLQGISVTIC